MWMHQRTAVNPTPMTNDANAMPTVTSVDTPTRITCEPGNPLLGFPIEDIDEVVVSLGATISIFEEQKSDWNALFPT